MYVIRSRKSTRRELRPSNYLHYHEKNVSAPLAIVRFLKSTAFLNMVKHGHLTTLKSPDTSSYCGQQACWREASASKLEMGRKRPPWHLALSPSQDLAPLLAQAQPTGIDQSWRGLELDALVPCACPELAVFSLLFKLTLPSIFIST